MTVGQLYTAGLIAGGIAATSFQYLGISVAVEREGGQLRRLAATPMPRTAYFAGKVIQVLVCSLAETTLLLAVGVAFYHVQLPDQPGRWLTFAWVFLLGSAALFLTGLGWVTVALLNLLGGSPFNYFIVDRHGKVAGIHTGYSGPATGIYYQQFVKEFIQEIDRLLKS